MQIISHRGYWIKSSEKNKIKAFERSFGLGYGTETDVRDYNGKLVISHDIADSKSMTLKDFFILYNKNGKNLPLALNIKSDGLHKQLLTELNENQIHNYFVFDMSIPDTINYNNYNINFYSRLSEYEKYPVLYNQSKGIWLDAFNSIWYDKDIILELLKDRKKVVLVSNELHKRDHIVLWNKIKEWGLDSEDEFILCTDYPEKANKFFI
jgi:glycerophosphoryl diester phosphodiesterase|tara:strand:- start:1242 stop:1868 length:627 start_codon:yes stop_codon:yes gene_type:complete